MCFSIFAFVHPQHLQIKDFTYLLPEHRIAKFPLAERDLSKLLIYKHSLITESTYRHLADYLPQNSLLVFNNSKVIHARLLFKNTSGADIEIFCLEPAEETNEMAIAMSRQQSLRWKCLVGQAAKWKQDTLSLSQNELMLQAKIIERHNSYYIIEFKWQPDNLTFAEVLGKAGAMPIPPYLKRASQNIDHLRYQTLYAKYNGSVAAPTAGLHFTEAVFAQLNSKHILRHEVTLHVGAGTFKPVKSESIREHEMHSELMEVKKETIEAIANTNQQSIIAVGTTSLRTLETLYWMGLKAKMNPSATLQQLEIKQWDTYEPHLQQAASMQVSENLQALLIWMKKNNCTTLFCKTQILIAPPYRLRVCAALITNFHQPSSTLLLLVAAVVKDKWKQIYQYALQNNFRFLSYGDGSLLFAD